MRSAVILLTLTLIYSIPLFANSKEVHLDPEASVALALAKRQIVEAGRLSGYHRYCGHPRVEQMHSIARFLENSSLFGDPDLKFQQLNYYSTQIRFLENMEKNNVIGGYEVSPAIAETTDQYEGQVNSDSPETVHPAEEDETQNDKHELFASQTTLNFIQDLSNYTMNTYGLPLTMTALTTNTDHDTDGHCEHFSGYGFDIRPLPGDEKTTASRSSKEDRKMNHDLIFHLLRDKQVKKVFYKDMTLPKDPTLLSIIRERKNRGDPPVEFLPLDGHDTHIHVSLYLDPQIERIATNLVEVLNAEKVWPPYPTLRRHKTPAKKARPRTGIAVTTGAN